MIAIKEVECIMNSTLKVNDPLLVRAGCDVMEYIRYRLLLAPDSPMKMKRSAPSLQSIPKIAKYCEARKGYVAHRVKDGVDQYKTFRTEGVPGATVDRAVRLALRWHEGHDSDESDHESCDQDEPDDVSKDVRGCSHT